MILPVLLSFILFKPTHTLPYPNPIAAIEAAPPPDVGSPPPVVEDDVPGPQTAFVPPRLFHRPAVSRPVPFQVQAWAFGHGHHQVYVHRIQIAEVPNWTNGVGQYYGHTFSVQTLTLPTAHLNKTYQVNITWSDGSHYSRWYRMLYQHGRTVTVLSPSG